MENPFYCILSKDEVQPSLIYLRGTEDRLIASIVILLKGAELKELLCSFVGQLAK